MRSCVAGPSYGAQLWTFLELEIEMGAGIGLRETIDVEGPLS